MVPRVTILLPVYNGEKYLKAAINSIRAQTFSDWGLWVLDDGSSDSSLEIARSFDDERIKALPNGGNLGVAKTLNRALEKVRSEFVARMDSDDECLPRRLERQVNFLQRRPDVALLGTQAVSAETGKSTFDVPCKHEEIRANLLFNCSFLHPTVMWRREAFERFNLAYEESPAAEDYDLWERACCDLKAANLPDRLLRYRNDPEVKVTAYVKQQKEGGRAVRKRAIERLGLSPDEQEMEVHHACAYDNLPQPPISLRRVDEWCGRIFSANQKARVIEQRALKDRLHLQRYYHLVRNRPLAKLRDMFLTKGELGAVPLSLAGRALVKRFAGRSIGGHADEETDEAPSV